MTFQNDNEVFEFIKERKNAGEIANAQQHQKRLRLLCFHEKIDPLVIEDKYYDLLPIQKKSVYQNIYKNHSKKLITQMVKHLNTVFYASGGSCEYYIEGTKEKVSFVYDISMVNGIGLMSYFSKEHIKLLFSCPSSFYFTKNKEEEYNETEPFEIKVLNIDKVVSLEMENNCVEAIAYTKKINSETKEYFVLDDTYRYQVQALTEENFVLVEKEAHGANKVPLVQIGNENRYQGNDIEKLSPLQVVYEDLKEYNTYKSFDTYAKFNSAFPKEIESETASPLGQKNKQIIQTPNSGAANEIPLPYYNTSTTNSSGGAYNNLFGKKTEIPFQMATNPEFTAQMRNMFFTVEQSRDLLDFRFENLGSFEESILENVLGNGFGKSDEKQQVKTATEVAASFVSQERTLLMHKQNTEYVMGRVIYLFGYMALQNKFKSVYLDLGSTFFLKTTFQAIAELQAIKSITSNEAIIEQKVLDVLVYSAGANINEIKRFEVMRMLQPYANRTPDYIEKNIVYFNMFPFSLYLFQNFSQILAQFENKNGKIEIYCENMQRFEELKKLFYQFAVEFFAEQEQYNAYFKPKVENGESN